MRPAKKRCYTHLRAREGTGPVLEPVLCQTHSATFTARLDGAVTLAHVPAVAERCSRSARSSLRHVQNETEVSRLGQSPRARPSLSGVQPRVRHSQVAFWSGPREAFRRGENRDLPPAARKKCQKPPKVGSCCESHLDECNGIFRQSTRRSDCAAAHCLGPSAASTICAASSVPSIASS